MTESMGLSAIGEASPMRPTTRPHLARGRATISSSIAWGGAARPAAAGSISRRPGGASARALRNPVIRNPDA